MILTTIGFCCGINVFEEILHAASTFFLHLRGDVTINIQGKSCRSMTNVMLDGFYVITVLQGKHSVGVPLRYNYDKPEKPRISRVFGYQARFFILFHPEKSSREVVIS